jgi:hypothetical protein
LRPEHFRHGKRLEQFTGFSEVRVSAKPLEHLGDYDISDDERLPTQQLVQLIRRR